MLTASADKLIKLWKAGKCEKTFRGNCLVLIAMFYSRPSKCKNANGKIRAPTFPTSHSKVSQSDSFFQLCLCCPLVCALWFVRLALEMQKTTFNHKSIIQLRFIMQVMKIV